jgi:hypothetical protein
VIPKRIYLTFQGGFVGTKCSVQTFSPSASPEWTTITYIYPEDVNRPQIFDIDTKEDELSRGIDKLKLVFEESSDFFGRIVIYDLRIDGSIFG